MDEGRRGPTTLLPPSQNPPVQVAFATNDAKTTLHWSPSSSIILASNKIKVTMNGKLTI